MRGLARIARAIETRWRCPPESLMPRSPTTVRSRGNWHDELVAMRDAAGLLDLVERGAGLRVADVVGDRAVEQEVVLQHRGELLAIVHQPQPRRGRGRRPARGPSSAG